MGALEVVAAAAGVDHGARVHVLGVEIVGYEAAAGPGVVLDRGAAMEQLRVPDEHVSGFGFERGLDQPVGLELRSDVVVERGELRGRRVRVARPRTGRAE